MECESVVTLLKNIKKRVPGTREISLQLHYSIFKKLTMGQLLIKMQSEVTPLPSERRPSILPSIQ